MRNQIEQTKAWKSLSDVQKNIHNKRVNMVEIENQYRIAKNIGKEVWLKEHHPSAIHKNIVLELLNEKLN